KPQAVGALATIEASRTTNEFGRRRRPRRNPFCSLQSKRFDTQSAKGPSMSSHHFHAVNWIDHHEARVFHFSPTDVERLVCHPDHPAKHIHHKANSIGSGHAAEDHAFLQAVAQSIADAGAVLVTGPANAKTELIKHISQHDPALMKIIVGVETIDHPSDGQLVAHGRRYFKAEDRMLPQKT